MPVFNLTEEELDKIASDFAAEIEAQAKKNEEFFKSDTFKEKFKQLKEHLEAGNTVTDNSLAYKTDEFHKQIDVDMFVDIHNAVRQASGATEVPDADWETVIAMYDGVTFETVYGQGSFTVARLATDEDKKTL